jgi:DNA-binding LytR/AlgR family response regulator
MCSAHDEFALKAIRYQVTDYLLKPLEIQDLISTVEKIENRIAKYKKDKCLIHLISTLSIMPCSPFIAIYNIPLPMVIVYKFLELAISC